MFNLNYRFTFPHLDSTVVGFLWPWSTCTAWTKGFLSEWGKMFVRLVRVRRNLVCVRLTWIIGFSVTVVWRCLQPDIPLPEKQHLLCVFESSRQACVCVCVCVCVYVCNMKTLLSSVYQPVPPSCVVFQARQFTEGIKCGISSAVNHCGDGEWGDDTLSHTHTHTHTPLSLEVVSVL